MIREYYQMEQEEKKQKSQAAENQASCSSLQPVEPHPFISVIPLAVLITLIVLVVKIFPDDAPPSSTSNPFLLMDKRILMCPYYGYILYMILLMLAIWYVLALLFL